VINWREKAKAFAIHFLVTLTLCAAAATLVFLIWFPEPYQEMLGGTRLFQVLVACDLGLGPLTSFVIYNSRKSRRELLFDYTIIGLIQLGAFCYGFYTVANTRPAYVAFVKDRIEVVTAGELDDVDLAKGPEQYRKRPLWGPRLVSIHEPEDPREREKVMFSAFQGKDYSVLPLYYVAYEHELANIKKRALPVSDLEKRHPDSKPLVADAVAKLQIPAERLLWLPVKHRKGFWTALLNPDTLRPVGWLPLDPY
jgi:hypothetical protein